MATQTIEIVSIGSAAAQLQKPMTVIRRAADELGILPAYRINEIPHFAAADLERIAEHLDRQRTDQPQRHRRGQTPIESRPEVT